MSFWKKLLGAKESPTTIHEAAKEGALRTVKALLKDNPDLVSSKDIAGNFPLHVAARYGHQDVAKLLLANKADVNAKHIRGGTPLYVAAEEGHRDMAELLLANGTDVDARDKDGKTPLHVAAEKGHKSVAELLLAKGADVNAKDNYGKTPLHMPSYDYKDLAELLLAKGADVNAKDNYGKTPLHSAAGHWGVAELLLANGADVNAKDKGGNTPLQTAEDKGHHHVTGLLRHHGGRDLVVEIQDVIRDGGRGKVKALLNDNPDLVLSSLSRFIRNNDAKGVRMLIGAGATVDSRAIEMAEAAVHQARAERAKLCIGVSEVGFGTEAALEYQRQVRDLYAPRERAVAAGKIIQAAEEVLALLQSRAATSSNPTPNPQVKPEISAVPTLTCAGCGKAYRIGDDAVAATLEHGLSLARGALIISDGSAADREDLVAALDASPENLAGAKEKARQNWKIIQDHRARGKRRTWRCKACDKVNAYP